MMEYPFTADDVGPSQSGNKLTELPLEERKIVAARWNANHEKAMANMWLTNRLNAYEMEMSVAAQLEAIMEAETGSPAKLDAMKAAYLAIKTQYPKREE